MNRLTFEQFLNTKCSEEGGYDGVLDDDYEEAFDAWLESKDVAVLIDYGNEYGRELVI